MGKEIFIRLVDEHTGHWGHVNFDDFRFHAREAEGPGAAAEGPPAPLDVYKYAGLTPEKAAEGDDRARRASRSRCSPASRTCISRSRSASTTAAGCGSPRRTSTRSGTAPGPLARGRAKDGDRILIFEDTDGDGKFDKKTVFIEGLNLVSGIEVGFGGVWVGAAPYLLFIPDQGRRRQARRRAADPARRLGLPGHARDAQHASSGARTAGSTAATASSRTRSVGKPGTPDEERMPINAGIWRYHPTQARLRGLRPRHAATRGASTSTTTARSFVEACVIPHCSTSSRAAATSGRRGSTSTRTPTTTSRRSPTTATTSAPTRTAATTARDAAGGGHAHCGPDVLPRRRLAGGVPRPALHGQHPRPAHQRGRAQAEGLAATSPRTAPTSC